MSHPNRDPWRTHGRHHPNPQGRDHRRLRRDGEADVAQDDGRRARAGRGDVAQPQGAQLLVQPRSQGPEVGPVRREPEVVRPHGGGQPRRLQLLPGPRLLHGPQRGARRGQGPRGAPLAAVRCVHPARARRHGVRRGDVADPADGDRRAGGPAARPARRARDGRAHGVHRAGEHVHAHQRRVRRPFPGPLRGLRPEAARAAHGRMTDDPFVTHRSLLFTVAYEMLGSAADAEDVVQETWLRWADVDRAAVRDPRAYLVRIVTRQALNRLRTLARQREEYVGEWLPEPLPTSPDVAEDVELAESVSIAMLTVLETLAPVERAVLVLHEVFDVPYEEIAEAVGKSSAAVRQIAHRAREHVAARRPRMVVSRTEQRQVVERFLAALRAGDVQGLMDVLAPDVVGDGRITRMYAMRNPHKLGRLDEVADLRR